MRLWWWRKVRYATIPKEARDIFERYGEFIISSVVTGGMAQRHGDLQKIYTDQHKMLAHAMAWLTERGDIREQREQRLETVEWAILIFAFWALLTELSISAHEYGIIGLKH
jgi:hypothetical protein